MTPRRLVMKWLLDGKLSIAIGVRGREIEYEKDQDEAARLLGIICLNAGIESA